jgi:hypothetical protein
MHQGGRASAGRPLLSLLMPRLKVVSFTVHASQEQARRWARVARYLGCRSVSAWLEELGEQQARRVQALIDRIK